MAAGDDDLALEKRPLRDMRLPPTPPEDYSDDHRTERKTPPMQDSQQLLTPDVTPPGMDLQPPRPLFRHEDSSRANSFRTAREEPSNEFLSLANDASSQVAEDTESEEDFAVDDEQDENMDDAPWLDIPGAFRDTPSNASSRSGARSNTRMDLLSTPSTGSSHKVVRPKQYLDIESPPSTSSSREVVRPKSYHHDVESPSERLRFLGEGSVDDSDEEDEDARSETSSGEYKEVEMSQWDDMEGYEEGEGELQQEDHEHDHGDGQDWEKHVSYMAADGDHESEKEAEGASTSTNDSQSSSSRSRLSGHGRRVEINGGQQIERPKGINNPAFVALGHANNVAEQGLLKRGSDESSNLRSNGTPSPSIGVQRRRQRAVEKSSKKEGAKPGAREARNNTTTNNSGWLPQRALPSPDIPAEFLAAPPRDSNDLVYKHIQQANMDRFEALNTSYPCDSAVIPTDAARNRHLRHVTKRQSLRSMSESSSHMPSTTASRREHSLRHKKAFSPQELTPQKASLANSPDNQRSDTQRQETQQKARSASGSHSLRHEKRPLRGAGRPLHSNETSPSLSHAAESPKGLQSSPFPNHDAPNMRHSSLPVRLASAKASASSPNDSKSSKSRAHALRRSSREYRLENKPASFERHSDHSDHKDPSTIIETTTYVSPHLQSLASHHHNRSQGTPFSAGAVSDRTEMEVCEAQNVAFYPHSNNSLLVVEHGSKPENKDQGHVAAPTKPNSKAKHASRNDKKHATNLFVEEPEHFPPGIAVNGKSIHTVESPLTNPREAPIPPVIQFIPPTPAHDDDEDDDDEEKEPPSTPQRRGSLANRARRYSEVVVRPLFGRTLVTRSHNIHPSPTMSEKRDEKLHPNWVPNSFWEDDDDDEYSDFEEPFERLPAGGDTSEHPRSKFPRKMSVRMPGFRGSGGFLLGNSLGMDRHGTNKRRPHVDLPERSTPTPNMSVRRVSSLDSVTTKATTDGKIFVIPGTRTRLQYVGFKPIKDKMRKLRETKEDAAREKRRAELKDQIGMRIVHDA